MKIGFTGTMSVGKTTLVNALKELPEFKDYTFNTERSKYLRDLGIPLNTDSTIKGQMVFMAERASELVSSSDLITDRTIIDVMAFTRCAKSIPLVWSNDFNNLAKHIISDYDCIFYVSPKGVEIENNGVRTTDSEYRDEIDKEIKTILKTYKRKIRNYYELEGDHDSRIEQIKQILFS